MTSADELAAVALERAKRRYPETLSGEEQVALVRGAHSLRVKGLLVGALEAALEEFSCMDAPSIGHRCGRCDSEVDRNCEVSKKLLAALAEAQKETP